MFGDLERTCSAIWRNRVRRFGGNVFGDFGENVFDDLEKTCSAILENTCSAIWRKRVRRFGETRSTIWRNVVGTVMVILY